MVKTFRMYLGATCKGQKVVGSEKFRVERRTWHLELGTNVELCGTRADLMELHGTRARAFHPV